MKNLKILKTMIVLAISAISFLAMAQSKEAVTQPSDVKSQTQTVKTTTSLLADIRTQLDNVDKMVAAKKLDMVHNHAELIGDACKELAKMNMPGDTSKRTKIEGYLHTMEKIAVKLDEYGDAGNAEAVTSEVKKGRSLLTLLEKQYPQTTSTKTVMAEYYTCPMHPEIHETKPGNCPKCGMTLVLKKEDKDTMTNTKGVDHSKMKM